jgi:hypothetical protein
VSVDSVDVDDTGVLGLSIGQWISLSSFSEQIKSAEINNYQYIIYNISDLNLERSLQLVLYSFNGTLNIYFSYFVAFSIFLVEETGVHGENHQPVSNN